MKSGETLCVQPAKLPVVESALVAHLKTHGLATFDVLDFATELKPHGREVVRATIRRLIRQRIVKRGKLYHGRSYFVLSTSVQQPAQLLSEPVKLILYARSVLIAKHRPELKPIGFLSFDRLLGKYFPGQGRSFLLNQSKAQTLAFMRVDNRVQSRPARAAQVIRSDVLRMAKNPLTAELMKSQHFEYIWITTTQPRAKAVLEKFRQYSRVGKSPVTDIVMPELLSLLIGIPIHKEILTPR